MKIVVVAGDYPAEGHQMLVFVQQLVHAIIDLGTQITVVAPQSVMHAIVHRHGLLPTKSIGRTENGREYKIYRPYTISFGNNKFLKQFSLFCNSLIVSHKVSRIDKDILYTHFWDNALLVFKQALKNNIPLYVACGEGDNALEDLAASISQKDRLKLASAVKGVISVSSENKSKCIEYGLASKDNIDVFPNCVNTSIFHKSDSFNMRSALGIKEDDFLVVFVGGFIPRKGPDRVAKAIQIINDPSIKVMFIGKPFPGYPYDFDCSGIIHKGPLDHNLLPQYLNCADVFVMPTQKEGCCNAIVEALAMGIPVISSKGAFNDDILDSKNSIRIDPNNVDEIVHALRTLKDNPSMRKQMSDYSLSRHDEYSIEGRARRIIEFITKKLS